MLNRLLSNAMEYVIKKEGILYIRIPKTVKAIRGTNHTNADPTLVLLGEGPSAVASES